MLFDLGVLRVRLADLIHEYLFNLGDRGLSLLNARPRRQTDVDRKLVGIHLGEQFGSRAAQQKPRAGQQHETSQHQSVARLDDVAEEPIEPGRNLGARRLPALASGRVLPKELRTEAGYHKHSHEVAGADCEHNRYRKRLE